MTQDQGIARGEGGDLIARLERGERSNKLDVLIECALFRPDEKTFDAVPNNAGTKVIYANRDGSFSTHWARDWTITRDSRWDAAQRLRALRTATLTRGSENER